MGIQMERKVNAKARTSRSKPAASGAKPRPRVKEFVPKTELGKVLWAIRKEIEASGVPLLNRDELEEEIKSRRDGYYQGE
jgi:hypothetical protein